MKNHFLVSVVTLGLAGCGGGATGGGEPVVLDIEAAIDNPRPFDLTEIARDIEFIPLDRTVPVGEINVLSGVRPAGDGFYIVAKDGEDAAWHFDRKGKFVSDVGRIGRGPGETNSIVEVAPNDATGEIYINGTTDVVGLDAEGKEFARTSELLFWGMTWHGDRLLTLPVAMPFDEELWPRDTIPFIDMYDRELKLVGSIPGPNVGQFMGFPSGPDQVAPTSPPFFSDNGKRLLVRQGRGDTLYHYSAGTIRPAYLLDLGKYSPPAEVFGLSPTASWNDRNFTVINAWEGERWMLVAASNIIDERTVWGLVFDRNDLADGGPGNGFSATSATSGKPGLQLGGVKFTPGYIRDNRLVGYIQALDLVDNASNVTHPRLKELADTITEDSNPIIVSLQL
jgi:hypothetical protein